MDIASFFHQELTYWPRGVNDGFGLLSFTGVTPRVIACRWQDTQTKFRGKDGTEHVSDATIYVAEELEIGGYVVLGDAGTVTGTDPIGTGAVEIRHLGVSPSLHADQSVYKVLV